MAIEKKLIHFKNRSKFNEKLNNNEILPYSIVFIADTHEIYTHGNFFGNVTNVSEVENIIANSDTVSDIVSALENNYTKLEVDNKLSQYVTESELTEKGYATIGQVETVEQNTKGYTDEKVAALVNGAPETLNTLDELAAALKDNKDIVDVLNASIGSKQDKIEDLETIRANAEKGATALPLSGGTMTGEIKFNIADLTYKDISAGIIAAFKVPRAQINELISNYIYLGSASEGNSSDSSLVIRKYSSITDKSPSGTADLVTIDTLGNVTAIGGFTGNLTGTATKATTAESATNADAVNGTKIAIVSSMPSSPDSSTLYFVK